MNFAKNNRLSFQKSYLLIGKHYLNWIENRISFKFIQKNTLIIICQLKNICIWLNLEN